MAEEQNTAQASESEAPQAAAGKKKGKLPVIVMLAVLLGAGGFFGVKMRQPKVEKEPEVKLGEVMALKEFLVNLTDGGKYLRTEIQLHLKEGAEIKAGGEGEGGGGPETGIIQDAVIRVLTSKSSEEIQSSAGKDKLKREIAEAVNKALEEYEQSKKGGKPEGEAKGEKDAKPGAETARKHPTWASDTGPVLKVYFTSFATQ